ncbi:hypothetical protein BSL78_05386 [Apostichopus japonicus]|uniref:Thyroglobulin type-1 domain-containing protein n=1 Tax=Stichopus japonicus TaxID=307972 RepID=A0A2G8LBT0_STIJA|nr:hypothetical protein BSL78_05386 [Apostichopus japonicus]
MEPSNEDRPADNGEELPQVGGDELPPTPCRTAHEIWEASRWSFFTTEPVCDSDGYYVNQRCYPLYGYCICIDRNTGVEIESSKLSKPTIDCTDVVAPQPEQVEAPEPEPKEPVENGCTWEGTHYNQDETFYRDCNLW